MRIGPGGINHVSNTTKDGQNVAKDGQTGAKQDYQAVVKEDESIAAKGEIAVKNGPNAKRAVQTVLQMTDKGVSYLKSNLPPELKPAALKTNLAAPAFKYVRDQITLKKLAYLAFELVTAKLYFKLGLGILYGLANLAWKRYREEKTEDVTTKAGERSQVMS